jgi:carboxypeptidase Taq
MSNEATEVYDELIGKVKEANLLGSTSSLLGWDQETLMPPGGVNHRANQLAQLARMGHQMATTPQMNELLDACEAQEQLTADPLSDSAVNLREIRHEYDRATKLPTSLVEEMVQTTSRAKHEWAEARKNNDFNHFKPWLEKVIDLNRKRAACYGYPDDGEPWDALAENFEPGCTAQWVESVFTPLREKLVGLLQRLMDAPKKPSNSFNELKLPIEQQDSFVRYVATEIGFDFKRGRLDQSTHPFCSGTHCNDIRMTTRFAENNVNDALGSTMHESGHGIYEQGLLEQHIGTPMGHSVSLSIHESQSRMWENQVGRSESFWKWCYPKLADHFGSAIQSLSHDEIYGGANIVRPDFIRVEADEVTYNMHIMIRFEIERDLLSGKLDAADVPAAWNQKYKDYLDLDVPDDQHGCLQDIHWSMGAMGYFPTYTLGNLFAAQIFDQAKKEMPDLYQQFEAGEFASLKTWLNEKIHSQGMRYRSQPLCEQITGKPLSAEPLLAYLENKLAPIYGL